MERKTFSFLMCLIWGRLKDQFRWLASWEVIALKHSWCKRSLKKKWGMEKKIVKRFGVTFDMKNHQKNFFKKLNSSKFGNLFVKNNLKLKKILGGKFWDLIYGYLQCKHNHRLPSLIVSHKFLIISKHIVCIYVESEFYL